MSTSEKVLTPAASRLEQLEALLRLATNFADLSPRDADH
jgi:hypothetical protein